MGDITVLKQIDSPQTELEADIFDEINSLMANLLRTETAMDLGWVRLGVLLNEVLEKELWRERGYKSFGKYLDEIRQKCERGRTQILAYMYAIRDMKEHLTEGQMKQIGISKLTELRKSTKQLGTFVNSAVIEMALDANSSVRDVRKKIAEEHHLLPEEKSGTWYDDGGFMVNADEKLVLDSAKEAALRCDPAVQESATGSVRVKEARLRQSMEFLATHGDGPEVL